ncbi:MAG: sigma-54 dependent transcriptional regulator [Xanthomonadales bacterium]|jgi:DNA-binding NtrC family response regulator|nr:sigma-54 dependent transcriptional regulator [Xanthomonadales bacterium]
MSQAYILVVDDEPDIRELVKDILEDEAYEVEVAENGEAARNAFARRTPDLVLLDIWMPDIDGITLLREWSSGGTPDCPVVVMSGHGNLETAVEATRLGAHDFVQKPISLAKLLSIVSQALESGRKKQKHSQSPIPVASQPVGSSALMQLLRNKAEQAAQHDLPVLITGEKGSGRENLARFIHGQSVREGQMICMDHCELAAENSRSYLLGRDSAGSEQEGLFDRARGGTLFIPDLQDIPTDTLKIIHQVLESGHYVHEGSSGVRNLDCRLIVSASDELLELAGRDETLQQLYYRLNVLPLDLPPLRDRPDDVPELVRFYAEWFPNSENLPYRSFSVAAQNRLRNHSWPGNVRELRNLVQRLLVLGGDGEVTVNEVDEALKQSPTAAAPAASDHPGYFDLPLREAREQFEREYLVYQLKQAGGSVGRLADAVGMERTHLYRKLRTLGVDPKTAARNRK